MATIANRWQIANEEQGRAIVPRTLRAPLERLWAADIARDTLSTRDGTSNQPSAPARHPRHQ